MNFLLENESVFSDALLVTQEILKRLEGCSEIKGPQKEVGTSEFHLFLA
jgi:zinc finger/BTB domain-containing protein 40